MKLRELELEIKTELAAAGLKDSGYEARQLLSAALDIRAGELLTREAQEIDLPALTRARHWATERARGVPLAYLSGKKGFYKHEFLVEPGVLVPRPESELVVETSLSRAREANLKILNLADLGCGSGVLGLSLLLEFPGAKLTAIDSSAAAARVTLKNAEHLGVEKRTRMVKLAVEKVKVSHDFELIVANPPYISHGDANVEPSVHEHEPHEALYAAENGFAAIKAWSAWASENLSAGGIFVCEIGTGQSAAVRDIMSKLNFKEIRVANDLAGHDRVVSAQRR